MGERVREPWVLDRSRMAQCGGIGAGGTCGQAGSSDQVLRTRQAHWPPDRSPCKASKQEDLSSHSVRASPVQRLGQQAAAAKPSA